MPSRKPQGPVPSKQGAYISGRNGELGENEFRGGRCPREQGVGMERCQHVPQTRRKEGQRRGKGDPRNTLDPNVLRVLETCASDLGSEVCVVSHAAEGALKAGTRRRGPPEVAGE